MSCSGGWEKRKEDVLDCSDCECTDNFLVEKDNDKDVIRAALFTPFFVLRLQQQTLLGYDREREKSRCDSCDLSTPWQYKSLCG
jgi:hypothetical protein